MSCSKIGNGAFEERRGDKENDIAPDAVRSREILSRAFEELEANVESAVADLRPKVDEKLHGAKPRMDGAAGRSSTISARTPFRN